MEAQVKTQPQVALHEFSPLAMAFLGDAVYELFMRTRLLEEKEVKAASLSTKAAAIVCATKQAALAQQLEPELSEVELAVFKRGRNAKTRHQPRGAVAEYHQATGLEALLGYLYQFGYKDRLDEILWRCWHLCRSPV